MERNFSDAFRILLVGVGRIGSMHLFDLIVLPGVKIVAVADTNPCRLKESIEKANCKGFESIEKALEAHKDLNYDGVLICTPTGTHYEFIKLALNYGIPVFCEKPIAQNLHEIDELFLLAGSKNLVLLCGFQRRFDQSFVKLKKSLESGSIGNIHLVKSTSRDHPLPSFKFLKTSGGIFHDCITHDIDVHRWLIGEDPFEVFASGAAWIPEIKEIGDYDCVAVLLKYPSGITSSIDIHRNAEYGYDQRIEVMGSMGMVQANNIPQTSWILSGSSGVQSDVISHSFSDRYPQAYKEEVIHFMNLVKSKNTLTPRISYEDVRKCLIITSACEESARKGIPIRVKYD